MVLDKNVTKYIYLGGEKIKASYSQSKTSGNLFFDVSVNAGSKEELKQISKDAIDTCSEVCNDFNKALLTNTTSAEGETKNKKKKVVSPETPSEKLSKTKGQS